MAKFKIGCKTAKENIMNKKIMTCCAAILLVTAVGSLSAAATSETPSYKTLWDKADSIADASESYLPGIRQINFYETDGKGNNVYADQAVVLLEGVSDGRYIQVQEFGDSEIFDLMERYTDGMIISPFTNNLHAMSYSSTGVNETIDGITTEVYTFSIALDRNLLNYDPNYTASGEILGWDGSDLDGNLQGTIWLNPLTGAPVKQVNSFNFPSNTQEGTLTVEQTIYFTYANGIVTPNAINTTGKLTIAAGEKGRILVSNFTMNETQSGFWHNAQFVRGQ
jgi:hypothetical protein